MKLDALVFVSLNALRVLSVVCTLLVLSATIDLMVIDGRVAASFDVADLPSAANVTTSGTDADGRALVEVPCEYIPGSDVPLHAWGLFWAQLSRVFTLVLCIIACLSEVSWGGLCDRFFRFCLPILGPDFGTAPLGMLQMMIGASLLSHYLWTFPLVVSWMLFIVGMLNLAAGAGFRARGKQLRSLRASKRASARQAKALQDYTSRKGAAAASEPASGAGRSAAPVAGKASDDWARSLRGAGAAAAGPAPQPQHLSIRRSSIASSSTWSASGLLPPRRSTSTSRAKGKLSRAAHPTIHDDFPSLETPAHRELLRRQAREANARLDRRHEELDAETRRAELEALRKASQRRRQLRDPDGRHAAPARSASGRTAASAATGVSRKGSGASTLRRLPSDASSTHPIAALPRSRHAVGPPLRRSLVLSRALRDIKRVSVASSARTFHTTSSATRVAHPGDAHDPSRKRDGEGRRGSAAEIRELGDAGPPDSASSPMEMLRRSSIGGEESIAGGGGGGSVISSASATRSGSVLRRRQPSEWQVVPGSERPPRPGAVAGAASAASRARFAPSPPPPAALARSRVEMVEVGPPPLPLFHSGR